jgi:DNA-binding response OmpR family regulator
MEESIKILLVEDNEEAARLVYEFLVECNFYVDVALDATESISFVKEKKYDIALLDLSLPDISGLEVLKKIKNTKFLPIIVISALSDIQTKIKAFKFGASDYMVKPINFEELEARIWVVLGRYSNIKMPSQKNIFEVVDNKIIFMQKALKLTMTEFEILSTLIKYKNKTLTREELASFLSSVSSSRSLDYHIKNIRKKIGDNGKIPKFLKTEYGIGYRLDF